MAHFFWGMNNGQKAAVKTESIHRIGNELIRISVADKHMDGGVYVDIDLDAAENLIKQLQSMIRCAKKEL